VKQKKQDTDSGKAPVGKQVESEQKPVALTVKIDGGMYVRLGTLRASQRRTHQDILKQALEEYLDREGA